MHPFDQTFTVLSKANFDSVSRGGQYSYGLEKGTVRTEEKSITYKIAFATKSILESLFNMVWSSFLLLTMSRSVNRIVLGFFWSMYDVRNNLPLNEELYTKAVCTLMLRNGLIPIHYSYFGENPLPRILKLTNVYLNKESFEKAFEIQKMTPRHSIFRKNVKTDMRPYFYGEGTVQDPNQGVLVIGEVPEATVPQPKIFIEPVREDWLEDIKETKEEPKVQPKPVEKTVPVKKEEPKEQIQGLQEDVEVSDPNPEETPKSQR
jgi:hypothetical protein